MVQRAGKCVWKRTLAVAQSTRSSAPRPASMLTRLAATRTRVRATSSLVRAATRRTALALGAASTGVVLAPTVSVRAFSVASSLAAGSGAGSAAAEESRVVHIRSESQFDKLVGEKPSVIGYYTARCERTRSSSSRTTMTAPAD